MKRAAFTSLLFVCAAAIGFCLPVPDPTLRFIRIFDAAVCSLLAVMLWGAFHFLGMQRHPNRRVAAEVLGLVLLWGLLVVGLLLGLRRLFPIHDEERLRASPSDISVNQVVEWPGTHRSAAARFTALLQTPFLVQTAFY